MKTEINLSDFEYFDQFAYKRQISDAEEFLPLVLARVLCYKGNNHVTERECWWLNFQTVYVNTHTNEIMHELTKPTMNSGKEWVLTNNEMVIATDENFQPIENPDFDDTQEESEENTRWLMVTQYNKFSEMLFAVLTPLMNAAIDSDDQKGSFNNKKSDGTPW